MATSNFQQVLMDSKSVLFARSPKLPMPVQPATKGYDTPYLRRRMYSRLRG